VFISPLWTSLSACGSSPEPSPTLNLHGSETILIAEDHDSIREMVRQTLVGLGYRVLAASDGEQALRLCETETPALAILDVIMPHMGGAATAAALLARLPNLPVLFTSGYSESASLSGVPIPSSRYLQKPYSPTALGRAVREILDTDRSCVSA
jgi:two-component system, cell cycle sensor histidine kinase and response regulator CckA